MSTLGGEFAASRVAVLAAQCHMPLSVGRRWLGIVCTFTMMTPPNTNVQRSTQADLRILSSVVALSIARLDASTLNAGRGGHFARGDGSLVVVICGDLWRGHGKAHSP